MMTLCEAASNSSKAAFFALFIKLFHPNTGTRRLGVLTQRLASVFATLLRAQEPLVVTIPAVQGLVVTVKTHITRSRSDGLDLAETSRLLLG
jgi:hypothetical protein